MEKFQLDKLETSINQFREELRRLTADDDTAELPKIIHRPGWTTLAEYLLVTGLVDSMRAQVRVLVEMKQALLAGSREVGEKTGAVR